MRFILLLITVSFLSISFTQNSFSLKTHKVKSGENLSIIAKKYNTSVAKLKSTNNLQSSNIRSGQKLSIPENSFNAYNRIYTVQKGETLGGIAHKFGLSSRDLVSHNNLSSSNIKIGQKIKIPEIAQKFKSIDKNNIVGPELYLTHTVKKGDTLIKIAKEHKVSVSNLKIQNNINNNNIKIGQRLVIPNYNTPTNLIAENSNRNKERTYNNTSDKQLKKIITSSNHSKNPISKNDLNIKTSKELIEKSEKTELSDIQSKPITYTVKKGDTLSQIAEKHNVRTSNLKKLNELKKNNIRIGQKLKIPLPTATKNIEIAKAQAPEPDIKRTYKVKSGDTLSEIAEFHGVSTKKLREHNGIKGNKIRTGQKLTIPDSNPPTPITIVTNDTEPKAQSSKTTNDENTISYTVQHGDTASQIADKIGIKTKELLDLNNLTKSNIKIGQKLKIPNNSKAKDLIAKQKSNNKNKVKSNPEYYTIKKGDTLSGIARKYNISTNNLKLANNINSNKIIVGKKLFIPGDDFIPEVTNKIKYKVKRGDSLLLIANKFDTNVKTLKKLNNLSSNTIQAGKTIFVPDNGISQPLNKSITYKVVKGDNLGIISRKFGVSISEIKSINNLRSSNIKVGQKLSIPSNGLSSKTVTKTVRYKVRSGDSLSLIASRYNTTTKDLKKANRLKSSNISIGQVIKIPVTEKLYVQSDTRSKYTRKRNDKSSDAIVKVAKRYLGAPYKFGGTSTRTGIDCSAYVKKVYGKFDVELPRTARDIYKKGRYVRKRDLEEGDLVFFRTYAKFPSHVGIYIGNDKFIHASSAKNQVTITNLNKNYYRKRYIGAKRIATNETFFNKHSNKL